MVNKHGKNHSETKAVGYDHLIDQELSPSATSRSPPVGAGHDTKFLQAGRKGVSGVISSSNRSRMGDVLQSLRGALCPSSGGFNHHWQKSKSLLLAKVARAQVGCFALSIRRRRPTGRCAQDQALLPRVRCNSKIQRGGRAGQAGMKTSAGRRRALLTSSGVCGNKS